MGRTLRRFVVVGVVVAGVAAGAAVWWWARAPTVPSAPAGPVGTRDGGGGGPEPPPAAVYACARCHVLPPPDILPRDEWPRIHDTMAALTDRYRLGQSITPEEMEVIRGYFGAHAPAALPELPPDPRASPLSFRADLIGLPPGRPGQDEPPIITNVRIVDLLRTGRPGVLVCSARDGIVSYITAGPSGWEEWPLARVPAPAHTEVFDADGDGRNDIAVACLGKIEPTDELVGGVVLLMGTPEGFVPRVLGTELARACDVRPADLDGDGDTDLLVGTFGLYKVGEVLGLERLADGSYAPRTIFQSNGVTHAATADFDGDRRPDFVTLVAQQHEQVMLFMNQGKWRFEKTILWQGPHPMFGCSGLELVDLDRDGDTDILFTNGDALDFNTAPKPWHGVQWLENRGDLRFRYHDIGRFYGAYRAAPADLDGDGDLDIVATSMMNRWSDPSRMTVIWYENVGAQRFTARALSASPTFQVTADVGDLNGDGRPDVVTGGMYVFAPYFRVGRVTVFTNLGPSSGGAGPGR